MPRRCTICHHPRHEEIAVSLFRDGTRATARRFQVSLPSLDRHKRHLSDPLVKAQQAEVVCEATRKVKSHPAVSCAIYTRASRHFFGWARKGFRFRKPAASHRQAAGSAKTA